MKHQQEVDQELDEIKEKASRAQLAIRSNLAPALAIKSEIRDIIAAEALAEQQQNQDKEDTTTDDLPDDDAMVSLILESFVRARMTPQLAAQHIDHVASKFCCSPNAVEHMKTFFLSPGVLDPAPAVDQMDTSVGAMKRPIESDPSSEADFGDDHHPDDFEVDSCPQFSPQVGLEDLHSEDEEETPTVAPGNTTPSSEDFLAESCPVPNRRKKGKFNAALEQPTPVPSTTKKSKKKEKNC